MHSKLGHQSILNMIAAVVEYYKNQVQISSAKRLSPPQLRPRAVTPQNNQIQFKHPPMPSHNKTIKCSSITPPCSRTTKHSNPAQSLPYAFIPQNNHIQLNQCPMLSHHKTIKYRFNHPPPPSPRMLPHNKTVKSGAITPPCLAPKHNQVQLNHFPMLSHHNTIKSNTKQSNADWKEREVCQPVRTRTAIPCRVKTQKMRAFSIRLVLN